jgi:two-component system chemotaxis response regulator CheV
MNLYGKFKMNGDRRSLAGSNKIEVLMFYLNDDRETGTAPLYGINVFKVKELITLPRLTQKPNSHECSAGIANIRGKAVPVINLQKYYGLSRSNNATAPQEILIVTEFAGTTQGFIVSDVDEIVQLDWGQIEEPPELVSHLSGLSHGNTLTGICLIDDATTLMIIDVEQVIAEVMGGGRDIIAATELPTTGQNQTVLFVDDSRVARVQIQKMLEKMGFNFLCANNGQEALELLRDIDNKAQDSGTPLTEMITAVVTDVEMPVMDGYMLTKSIKSDDRLKKIPVMMHSSLSAEETIRLGDRVGVDSYVPKLNPSDFSRALNEIIEKPLREAG